MSGNVGISGSGVDLIEIDRIRAAVQRWGSRFLERVFCPEEIAYAQNHRNPFPHFAARFAAKEAVIRAVGADVAVTRKDITIRNTAAGRPYCRLNRKDFKKNIHISLSHTRHHAIACAIVTS